jgi:cellulose synthase (UDP-forming)
MPANNVKADFDRPTFPQPPSDAEKYSYINPGSAGLGLSSALVLGAFVAGSYLFIQNNVALLWVYSIFVAIAGSGMLWNVFLYFTVRKFDVEWFHCQRKWLLQETGYCPTVDVYLPSAGEDLDLLDFCYYHVSRLSYPKTKVFVLDDSARDEVKAIALRYGFEYIRRPNQGEHKKAGNLRYAFPMTDGELILVLDADMCPRSDMLDEMVWLFGKDPSIGLIQTPHYFRVRQGQPIIQRGASLLQEIFFRVTQPAWDRFGAAICCGSNAVYRRTALVSNNGPALIERSEDVSTGLVVIKEGFLVRYLPLALAAGLSPDTLRSFVNQLYRWSAGAYQTRTSSFLWNRKIPFQIQLIYCSSVVYFLTTALGVIGFGIPGVVNLLFFPEYIWLSNYLYIAPAIVFSIATRKWWSSLRWDFSILYTAFILGYISLVSSWDFLRGDLAGWVPTNQRRAKGSSYGRFIFLMRWIPAIGLMLCFAGVFKNYSQIQPYSWVPAVIFWSAKFLVSRKVLAQDAEEDDVEKIYKSIESFNQEELVRRHYKNIRLENVCTDPTTDRSRNQS